MAVNQVIYGGETLIDLRNDTVTPETLAEGVTAHTASGEQITGVATGASTVDILNAVYPVGAVYLSTVSTSPATLFGFGTWERIQDTFLLAAGSTYAAGKTGGEATHKLTTDEIPVHNHSASTNETGAHTHTRGTMEIYGALTVPYVANVYGCAGAFGYGTPVSGYGVSKSTGQMATQDFYASRNWSGETSSNGKHSHTVTVKNTGGGAAHNNMPPYLAVYVWKRTA